MSTPPDKILSISELNISWGICGFASALAALYKHDPAIKETISNTTALSSRLLAEIKTFLVILQSENKSVLLTKIEIFTQSFPGFNSFKIKNYINYINRLGKTDGHGNFLYVVDTRDRQYSIAMPPDALVEYLKITMPDKKISARLINDTSVIADTAILGLGTGDAKPLVKLLGGQALYKGLKHWVYKQGDIVYNYGKATTLEAILLSKPTWHVVYEITF